MKILLRLTQFLPLSLFLYMATHDQSQNWKRAFEIGALAALIEFAILIPILKTHLSRLITGVNLFLIIGGCGFYFNINFVLDFLSSFRESALILSIFFICLLATFKTRTGIFEVQISNELKQKMFSIYFLAWCFVLLCFSWFNRGNTLWAGTIPVVSLVLANFFMGTYLARSKSSSET